MTDEANPMNKPSWFSNNLTLGNVLVLATLLVGGSVAYGRLERYVESQGDAVAMLKAEVSKIDVRLEDLPAFNYRITSAEEAIKATNARMDASLQTLSARIAEMNQLLGAIDTKVAVLTQRLEMATPQRRADAKPPG